MGWTTYQVVQEFFHQQYDVICSTSSRHLRSVYELHDKKTHSATWLIFHTFHSYSSPGTEECRSTHLYSIFSLIENAQMFYRVRVCKKSSNSWSNCSPNLDLCPIIGPVMLYDIISYYSISYSTVLFFLHHITECYIIICSAMLYDSAKSYHVIMQYFRLYKDVHLYHI